MSKLFSASVALKYTQKKSFICDRFTHLIYVKDADDVGALKDITSRVALYSLPLHNEHS
jgi:hypothetical protein